MHGHNKLSGYTVIVGMMICWQQAAFAQLIQIANPLSTINEVGEVVTMTDNVKVYGSFHFAESCTFDSERNLIIVMNAGNRIEEGDDDGYVSLINPDGSAHTIRWIGVNRDGLELHDPIGSAVRNGLLYTVDSGVVRLFDQATGQPREAFPVHGSTFLNGIGVTEDGTIYASNTRPEGRLYKVTADGQSSLLVDGEPLNEPNGVAIDPNGNVVVVNVGDNAVLTFNSDGELIQTEYAHEAGNDGVVILNDGTKYVSSVRFGSVSRIRPGQEAEVIAAGIPSAASMCYDSTQHQLVIPMNNNNSLAFVELDH
ncbi:MAG: SMP-30/gluconolactonase/LRE family protein [Gammaproteobacteria bacterium]|nr:SMP-30/gluconolactonase/LRE family protein [Gammaproteobacteria bacterium]